jgi:hypothetical protein
MTGQLLSSAPNYQRRDTCIEPACRVEFIAFAPSQKRCKDCGAIHTQAMKEKRWRKQEAKRKARVQMKRAQQFVIQPACPAENRA